MTGNHRPGVTGRGTERPPREQWPESDVGPWYPENTSVSRCRQIPQLNATARPFLHPLFVCPLCDPWGWGITHLAHTAVRFGTTSQASKNCEQQRCGSVRFEVAKIWHIFSFSVCSQARKTLRIHLGLWSLRQADQDHLPNPSPTPHHTPPLLCGSCHVCLERSPARRVGSEPAGAAGSFPGNRLGTMGSPAVLQRPRLEIHGT